MAGVPVVACWDGGGVLDVVPPTGAGRLTLPAPEAMGDAILGLLAEPDRRDMARLVGESWRARLDPDHVAEICERLVSRGPGWVIAGIRVLQWLLGLAIVGFAVRSLVRNWDELRAQPLQWSVEPGWILLSAVVVWLMYALLIAAWRRMLTAWGRGLDLWSAARIWTVSSLGKYLPGKGVGGGGNGGDGPARGHRRGPRHRLGRHPSGAGDRDRRGRRGAHRMGYAARRVSGRRHGTRRAARAPPSAGIGAASLAGAGEPACCASSPPTPAR